MKKIILAILIATLACASCKKSDPTASSSPSQISVTVDPSATNAYAGDQIPFAVKISGSNTLATIVVMQSIGGGASTQAYKNDITSKSLTTYTETENYTVPSHMTGPLTLTWTVTDTKNSTATATATIMVSPPVSVTVTPAVKSANAGDQLAFLVNMGGSNDLATIALTQSIGSNVTQINRYDLSSKGFKTYSYTETYTVPPGTTRPIILTWTIIDSKSNTNTATATIN